MEDNFTEEVQSKSIKELKEIVVDFLMYRGLLVAAAKKELVIRGIELSEEEKQKIEEKKAKRRADAIKSMEYKNDSTSGEFLGESKKDWVNSALFIPPSTATKEFSSFFSIFMPRQGYFITPILLNINILIFILMVSSGASILSTDTSILLNWGANFRPLTLEGQWWRLLTNSFIHNGFIHLLMNMYALFYIGLLLEPLLGRTRFISAYLLTGIIASLASISYYDLTVSAGASGAIFGMYGVFLPLLTTDLVEKRKALLTSITVFVLFNLVNGFSKNGIDNAAHIGGLITGIIIGYSFIPGFKKQEDVNLKLITVGCLTLGVLILTFFVCKNLSNDIGKYEENMKTFISTETKAMEVFKLPRNTPKDKLLYSLKERGIYYWNQNKKLIEEDAKLNLPTRLHLRDSKLKQ